MVQSSPRVLTVGPVRAKAIIRLCKSSLRELSQVNSTTCLEVGSIAGMILGRLRPYSDRISWNILFSSRRAKGRVGGKLAEFKVGGKNAEGGLTFKLLKVLVQLAVLSLVERSSLFYITWSGTGCVTNQ